MRFRRHSLSDFPYAKLNLMSDRFDSYQSPLSYRYASAEMRELFSERAKYRLWRQIWVALAEVENQAGLVSDAELADLRAHQNEIDIERIYEIEKETRHDVVAGIREFAEKATVGGGKIHLGATSMDINDNADAIRITQALDLVEQRLGAVLSALGSKIERYADTVCMGYTHLQPAEPTTIGYRLAFYASELLVDLEQMRNLRRRFVAKGMKGAIGTRASYAAILADSKMSAAELDDGVMAELGLTGAAITTQVVSRKYEQMTLALLASIGASLAKFAADLRILQSPPFGEWSEPFGAKQVGSSAMPFKKNPINAEKIGSLARLLAQLPNVDMENMAHSYLERTLDDSANRRLVVPEAFLLADEILLTAAKLITGLVVNERRVAAQLATYAPFAATEALIIEAVKCGADRQEMHELLREVALAAWPAPEPGTKMVELLEVNKALARYIPAPRLAELLDVRTHVGDAPQRAKALAADIMKVLA